MELVLPFDGFNKDIVQSINVIVEVKSKLYGEFHQIGGEMSSEFRHYQLKKPPKVSKEAWLEIYSQAIASLLHNREILFGVLQPGSKFILVWTPGNTSDALKISDKHIHKCVKLDTGKAALLDSGKIIDIPDNTLVDLDCEDHNAPYVSSIQVANPKYEKAQKDLKHEVERRREAILKSKEK